MAAGDGLPFLSSLDPSASGAALMDRLNVFAHTGGREVVRLPGTDAALGFLARLARDNDWSDGFARRAFVEYLRFCFLACVHERPVTPSDQVDQVWHLHLQYSRSYWLHFCPEVLQKSLHHGPTRGGQAQGDRWAEQYADTRAAYVHWFGHLPPADLWPGARVRFGRDVRWVRVNRDDVFILPRPRALLTRLLRAGQGAAQATVGRRSLGRAAGWLMGVSVALGLGLSHSVLAADGRPDTLREAQWNPYALSASAFLSFFVASCLVVLAARYLLPRLLALVWTVPASADRVEYPSLMAAWLRGGQARVMQTALARMMARGDLTWDSSQGFKKKRTPTGGAEIERVLAKYLQGARPRTPGWLEKEADRSGKDVTRLGLVAAAGWRWAVILFPIALAGPRIALALPAGRPIGYLLFWTILFTVFGLFMTHGLILSPSGHAWLRRYASTDACDPEPVRKVALRGVRAARGTALDDLWTAARSPENRLNWLRATAATSAVFHTTDAGGGDGGGGCGGGGCGGGGCGGGGCGG